MLRIPPQTRLQALGVAINVKALLLLMDRTAQTATNGRRRWGPAVLVLLTLPVAAQAQVVNLRAATESGDAIIMYARIPIFGYPQHGFSSILDEGSGPIENTVSLV